MRTTRIDLCGRWEFCRADAEGAEEWLPARVPGVVQGDLMDAGRLEDPFVGTNEDKVQWVGEARWTYRRRFDAPALGEGARAYLVFEGIDTFARVFLNGGPVGASDNMFIPWRFDVTGLLAAGENELVVALEPAPERAAAAAEAYGVPLANVARAPHGAFIRKAPCHFGWDWGPTLLTAGLWRPVHLEIVPRAFIDALDVCGDPGEDGGGTLTVSVEAAGPDAAGLEVAVDVTAPDGTALGSRSAPLAVPPEPLAFPVESAALWWPNGMGPQPLYTVRVRLVAGGETVDERTVRAGIRRLELVREPDAFGRSFFFRVNGRALFAKGANWIPADALPPRVSPARYRDLVDSCAEAGMNMLRVWGGGYYEDEAFYDRCDERGLLIWQDFMFSCALYPGDDPAFAENVAAEAASVVRRLRRRTCLALWCGNNEIESGWFDWGWHQKHPPRAWQGYERIFHDILPKAVAAHDPGRAYVPSSPTSAEVGRPSDPASGDVHYWAVWHGETSHFGYLESGHRFVSEFGFQSLPSMETLGPVVAPAERRLDSPSMLQHQKCAKGNEKIARAVEAWLGRPKDFESLIYLSQVYQATAIRTGVEHWRRSAPRTMGALYWQANDCWPVASWASLDYAGRWKALHYAARRFFAPQMVSGLADAERVRVWCTSETEAEAEVAWSVRTWDGRLLSEGRRTATLQPGSARMLELAWAEARGARPESAY
ncbi:MAG: hypothetical protein IMZ66_07745, partial [Planctomycetes bacterium]|nr:hypothetical protein [Planctomycetota bacterium]